MKSELEILRQESEQAEMQRRKTDRLHDFVTDLEDLKEKHGRKKVFNGDFSSLENLQSTVHSLRQTCSQSRRLEDVSQVLKNLSGSLDSL